MPPVPTYNSHTENTNYLIFATNYFEITPLFDIILLILSNTSSVPARRNHIGYTMRGRGGRGVGRAPRGKKNNGLDIPVDGDGAAATTTTASKRKRNPSQKVKEATVATDKSSRRGRNNKELSTASVAPVAPASLAAPAASASAEPAPAASAASAEPAPAASAAPATDSSSDLSTSAKAFQCVWSCFVKPCNQFLPPAEQCQYNGCDELVHPICQFIWENKNDYTSPVGCLSTLCPRHHSHFIEIGGGGSEGGQLRGKVPSMMMSVAALTAANMASFVTQGNSRLLSCAARTTTLFPVADTDTASPGLIHGARVMSRMGRDGIMTSSSVLLNNNHAIYPPVRVVDNSTLNSSPADSSLTDNMHPPMPSLPTFHSSFGSPDDVPNFDTIDEDMFDDIVAGVDDLAGSVADTSLPMEASSTTIVDINDSDDRDGGDSDDEGDIMNAHVIALARRATVADAERIVLSNIHRTPTDDEDEIDDDIGEPSTVTDVNASPSILPGAPAGWLPPTPPLTFTGYVQKYDGPRKEDIDNPAGWSDYTYTASFDKNNKYKFHTTPTGARVVPADSNGNRCMNGWDFHYKNWKGGEEVARTYARVGASFGNLKPASRKGCLDVNVLKKHGATAEMVKNCPLFFFQMLLPICNPLESGVVDDHRMPYFSNLPAFTNMYACHKGANSGYGHHFPPVDIVELVHWTGIPIHNGALHGKPSTIQHRWDEKTGALYDQLIADSMSRERFKDIKRYFKLCMVYDECKKGTPGYDPCAKYDPVWRCVIHNMNNVTAKADKDNTLDETTWGFSGYSGEAGGRLLNKPVSKGKSK